MTDKTPYAAGDEPARADDDAYEQEIDERDGEKEPDTFELELDGKVHTLPVALKGAFLRQADYTRKTQELAHHRRALEAERAAVEQHRQEATNALSNRAHLAAMDSHVAAFGNLDWRALAAQNPEQAQLLWRRFEHTQNLRNEYAQALGHYEAQSRAHGARETAHQMAETGRVLSREIEGWSPELAAKLTDYARSHGVTTEELAQAADPRVWKILHKAYVADQAGQRETTAKTQIVRPAVTVAGSAASGGGVRDELATKEWMHRRNEHVRRAR